MVIIVRAEEEHEASLAALRSEMEAQRAILQSRAVAQIEARWFAARKSQCFTQWHRWARRAVSQHRAVSQMLARIAHSCLYAALVGWHESAQQSKQHQVLASRAITRMRRTMLLSAFGGWSEYQLITTFRDACTT